ncbi:MAG: hypothetical protein WCD35_11985 [Mycobacteriales bacterium]
MRELASGIDALYLSGHGLASPGLLKELDAHRLLAEELRESVPVRLGDGRWSVEPRGMGRYRFCLSHEHGVIAVTDKEALPALRIQPRSEFLHAVGVRKALEWFQGQAEDAVPDVRLTGSRLDVYSDWQGWSLGANDRDRFVCRAARLNTREDGEAWTGFEFGRRKTGTVTARIYDKTRQVAEAGYDWWPAVWGSGFDRTRPVVRVEFELGRQALREFGLDGAVDVVTGAPGAWAALTGGWLTYRRPTADQTRARWPVADEWSEIQGASFAESAIGLERVKAGRHRGSLRKLSPGLVGYLAAAAAHLGTHDVATTLEALPPVIRDYEIASRKSFAERVRVKRRALGLT